MPDRNPPGRRATLLAAAASLAVIGALSGFSMAEYAAATNRADHTLALRHEVNEWLLSAVDAETGARGYLATGDPVFLEPYTDALAREPGRAAAVAALADGAGQAHRAAAALEHSQHALTELERLVEMVRTGHRDEASRVLAAGGGKLLMDRFRAELDGLARDEGARLVEEEARARMSGRGAVLGSIALTAFACLGLLVVQRRERAHDLQRAALEAASRERLDALSRVASALANARTRAQVAEIVVEHGMRATRADTCTLYQLDEAGDALELVADRGVAPEILEHLRRITKDSPNAAVLASVKAGTTVWAESDADYARLYPNLAATTASKPRARAFWSVPLVAEGRSLGLLGVGYYAPRAFPPEEQAFIETLCGHCAQALLRAARLEREDELQRWLSTTLRSIGDAVIATGADGRVTFMNPIAEQLTGWLEDEARGRPLEDVFAIHSELTRQRVESPVAKVLREGVVIGLANHTMLRSRRGVELPIDDSGAPIRGEGGRILGVVLVFRDATQEKRQRVRREFLARAGEALITSLDYEETLATVARFAVPTLADWCTVDLVDPRTGGPRQVAVAHVDERKVRQARELGDKYPPDPNAKAGIPQVIRSGQSELYTQIPEGALEAEARDEEHARRLRELNLESVMMVPLRGRGRTLGAMTFVYAESGRRYTQDDLSFAEDFARRAAMSIENAMAHEETEAARAREQSLRNDAELANRAKDEFLATVSHELRTPLSTLLMTAGLLRRKNTSPELERGLETIERNARLQAKLISDVLDISRIISGKLVLHLGTTRLADTIDAAVETVAATASLKNIRLEKDVPSDLTVLADADRLQQVVWNLLSNAVKFTPDGGRVAIAAGRDGADPWIRVTDTGEGIPRQHLPALFEPFRQADASITRRHGGLGLGLAIVRRLVVAHGGSVQAESDGEGRGATFTVRLPARASVAPLNLGASDPTPGPTGMTAREPIQRLDGVRVLLVEDELDALDVLADFLREQGAAVFAVPSARRALADLGAAHPDVIVSDIGMPEMDGISLIRSVRRLGGEPAGTPAIALTAFARAEDRDRALEAGYQKYLTKPVELARLARAIAELGPRA